LAEQWRGGKKIKRGGERSHACSKKKKNSTGIEGKVGGEGKVVSSNPLIKSPPSTVTYIGIVGERRGTGEDTASAYRRK